MVSKLNTQNNPPTSDGIKSVSIPEFKDLNDINTYFQTLTSEECKEFYITNQDDLNNIILNTQGTPDHSAKLNQFLRSFDPDFKTIYVNFFIIKKLHYHTFQDYQNLLNGLDDEHYKLAIEYSYQTLINIFNNKNERKLLLNSFTSLDDTKKQIFIDFYIKNDILSFKIFEDLDDINTILKFLSTPTSCLEFYELKKEAILDIITSQITPDSIVNIKNFLSHFDNDDQIKISDDIKNLINQRYTSTKLDSQVFDAVDVYTLIQLLPYDMQLNFYKQNEEAILNFISKTKQPAEYFIKCLLLFNVDSWDNIFTKLSEMSWQTNDFATYQSLTNHLTNKQYESILTKFQLVDNILKNKQESELLFNDLANGPIPKAFLFLKQYKNQLTLNHLGILLKLDFNKFFAPLRETIVNKISTIPDYFNICSEIYFTKSYEQYRTRLFDLLIEKNKLLELVHTPADFLQFNPSERNKIFDQFKNKYELNRFAHNREDFFIIFDNLNIESQQNSIFSIFKDRLFNNLQPTQIELYLNKFKKHTKILEQFECLTEVYVTSFKQLYKKDRNKLFFNSNFLTELEGKKINQQFVLIRNHAKKEQSRTQHVVNQLETQIITNRPAFRTS